MSNIIIRNANLNDTKKYHEWVNDPSVRELSYDSKEISWEQHEKWFAEKIVDTDYVFYVFQNLNNDFLGQVRFQRLDEVNYLVSISVGSEYRGLGYGSKFLEMACDKFFFKNPDKVINAFIKEENLASKYIFEKAGFLYSNKLKYKNFNSFHYILYANR
jgi:UDP-2,4-diacetamido-2,4,6-trideoxy-beta-L-altropyranose hydrolase